MRVLFIFTLEVAQSPSKPIALLEYIQFGISYISSYLKLNGHETRLLVLTHKSPFDLVDKYMHEFNPDIVGFTAVSSEYTFVEKVALYIKKEFPKVFLLIGGAHVSLAPDEKMLEIFNALCIGEGEEPTLELVTRLAQRQSASDISNLWIKIDGEIKKNPTRPYIEDLNSLPFPDRLMWHEWINFDFQLDKFCPTLLLGRGCPFICSYCSNHSLKKLASGNYVRLRSPESIVNEISSIMDIYPNTEEIYLEIETFGTDLKWAEDLCSLIEKFNSRRKRPIQFRVNLRIYPGIIMKLDALFQNLNKSNFRSINIGLESGSERVRKEVLRRTYSNNDVIHAVNSARKYGLKVNFFNIIGLPTETIDDFNQTIQMNRLCSPDHHMTSIFYPYPGTDLYNQCDDQDLIPDTHLSSGMERVRADLDFPQFRKWQIQKAYIWFDYYVYKDKKPIAQLTKRILEQYFTVYKGKSRLILPLLLLRDVLSPKFQFDKSYQEYKVVMNLIPAILLELKENSITRIIHKFRK
jgi:radical SAM superfamily enzyme YgiQ (UPF0313 family)